MNAAPQPTVRAALAGYYARQGLSTDGAAAESWTPLHGLRLRLPNFGWRRRALLRHDLHHLLTGFPCTAAGEFQMAAWEFAAGRFGEMPATLFCLPLLGMGAVAAPRRSFRAYVLGRRSCSLYRMPALGALLEQPLSEVRLQCLPAATLRVGVWDVVSYGSLVLLSLVWTCLPLAVLATACCWFVDAAG